MEENIKLIEQNYLNTPAIIGIFGVKILISPKIYEMEDNQIRYIFIYELSHYIQKDNLTSMIVNTLKIIYWFNPIIVTICNEIRKDLKYQNFVILMINQLLD